MAGAIPGNPAPVPNGGLPTPPEGPSPTAGEQPIAPDGPSPDAGEPCTPPGGPSPSAEVQPATPEGLPAAIAMELRLLRQQYAAALQEAGRGWYRRDRELAALSRRLGQLLSREARRSRVERGLSMRELALAVDRYFPELREWSLSRALAERLRQKGLSA